MRSPEIEPRASPMLVGGFPHQSPFCKPSQSPVAQGNATPYRQSRTRPALIELDDVDDTEVDSKSTHHSSRGSEVAETARRSPPTADPSVQELIVSLREDVVERLSYVEGKIGQVLNLQKQLLRPHYAACPSLFRPVPPTPKDCDVPKPRPSSATPPPSSMAPPLPFGAPENSWKFRRANSQNVTGSTESGSTINTNPPLKAWTLQNLDDKALLGSASIASKPKGFLSPGFFSPKPKAAESAEAPQPEAASRESQGEEPAPTAIEQSVSFAPTLSSPSGRSTIRNTIRRSSTGASIVFQKIRRAGTTDLQKKVWTFLEDPSSSRFARCFHKFWDPFILATVIVSVIQTIQPCPIPWLAAASLEISFDSLFTLEVLARYYVCQNSCGFTQDLYNIIDVCAAVPSLAFRLVLLAGSLGALDLGVIDENLAADLLVCVVPVLRVLKTLRRFDMFHLFLMLMRTILEALRVLLFALFILVLSFSSLIYMVEPRENIESVPQAMWLTIVTVTTVGYGDVTPASSVGTFVVAVLVLCSVLYMAMPIGIIGNAFTQIWQDRDRILLMLRTRERLVHWGYEVSDIIHLFKHFDADRDGQLCIDEFRKMIGEMQLGLNEERVAELFDSIDKDGSGGIEAKELVHCLFPHAYHQVYTMKRRESLDSVAEAEPNPEGSLGLTCITVSPKPGAEGDGSRPVSSAFSHVSEEPHQEAECPGQVSQDGAAWSDWAQKPKEGLVSSTTETGSFGSIVPTPPCCT